MKRLEIHVPDYNDAYSRVVFGGVQYLLRTTWNETANRWSFGLYTIQHEPIVLGIRMIPQFPLNMQIINPDFPKGIFGVYTDLKSVGRKDFVNGRAIFAYIPVNQEELQ